jgi:hypothetical protein
MRPIKKDSLVNQFVNNGLTKSELMNQVFCSNYVIKVGILGKINSIVNPN